jgi:hypothetical protein
MELEQALIKVEPMRFSQGDFHNISRELVHHRVATDVA